MSEKQKIHFITYGDSIKYLLSIKHIKNLANRSGIFETINNVLANTETIQSMYILHIILM